MIRYILFSLVLLLPSFRMQGQHTLGMAGSNFAGSHATFLNPSAIADSRYGFHLNLAAGHLTFSNTYFYNTGPNVQLKSLLLHGGKKVVEGDELGSQSYFQERLDGKHKMAHYGIELRLPSVMLKLGSRHSIAVTNRFRRAAHANNVSEDLARAIGFGIGNSALQNTPFTNSEAYFNTNAFTETGFTYALVLHSQEQRFLKAGVTIKKLTGMHTAHLLVSEANYNLQRTQYDESVMQFQQGRASLGYSGSNYSTKVRDLVDAFKGTSMPGSGWGMDVGFTYEHRPDYAAYQYTVNGKERTDHGENKYKYRIGASLLDVGNITYKEPGVRLYEVARQNLTIGSYTFEGVNVNQLGPVLEEALEVQASERKTEIVSGLPTALHLNFDYRLTRNVFVNTAVLQNLRGKEAIGMRQYSVLAVAPRLEGRKLELALPVYLTNNYRDLALGAMVRFGPFTVGSNNLNALLSSNKAVGPDLYFGMGFGIATGGKRQRIEDKARKRAAKEQRKASKAGLNSPAVPTPGSPAEPIKTAPADSVSGVERKQVNVPVEEPLTIPTVTPSETENMKAIPEAAPEPESVPVPEPEPVPVIKIENSNESETVSSLDATLVETPDSRTSF
ncbi:hypothetical protein FVR03_05115 [Pontibacter qinzhouensis]|uniref:DUF5723 domain-containing protein n=1 Tax=Pontibacter qinzhouensis TaxID=2603253 RepID=A0A5C8KDJ6_9BACT|nr:DUF5723 family protein [Pontibacter qinzhouensis]TXK50273.1 hypothetical protein FVR03_05115 [Pontibacter qinzhouensis]